MLHANGVHCSLAQYIRQLELKHSNSNIYAHNSLYDTALQYVHHSLYITVLHIWRLNFALALATKLAERISVTTEQENGRENNRRNVEQF